MTDPATKGLMAEGLSAGGAEDFGLQFARVFAAAQPGGANGQQDTESPTARADIGLNINKAAERTVASAFIGGGCCVDLSIEFTAGVAAGGVTVLVVGADATLVGWGKFTKAAEGYSVKECILTTKPGATVFLAVTNVTARLRWCEVFSG